MAWRIRGSHGRATRSRSRRVTSAARPGLNLDNIGELIEQVEGPVPSMILVDANLLLYALRLERRAARRQPAVARSDALGILPRAVHVAHGVGVSSNRDQPARLRAAALDGRGRTPRFVVARPAISRNPRTRRAALGDPAATQQRRSGLGPAGHGRGPGSHRHRARRDTLHDRSRFCPIPRADLDQPHRPTSVAADGGQVVTVTPSVRPAADFRVLASNSMPSRTRRVARGPRRASRGWWGRTAWLVAAFVAAWLLALDLRPPAIDAAALQAQSPPAQSDEQQARITCGGCHASPRRRSFPVTPGGTSSCG